MKTKPVSHLLASVDKDVTVGSTLGEKYKGHVEECEEEAAAMRKECFHGDTKVTRRESDETIRQVKIKDLQVYDEI